MHPSSTEVVHRTTWDQRQPSCKSSCLAKLLARYLTSRGYEQYARRLQISKKRLAPRSDARWQEKQTQAGSIIHACLHANRSAVQTLHRCFQSHLHGPAQRIRNTTTRCHKRKGILL